MSSKKREPDSAVEAEKSGEGASSDERANHATEESRKPLGKKAKTAAEPPKEDSGNGKELKETNVDDVRGEKSSTDEPLSQEPSAVSNAPSTEGKEAKIKHEQLSTHALVVFGLHPLSSKEELTEIMSKYGKIDRLETKMAFASMYCFCDYATEEGAHLAIKNLNGFEHRGKKLIVKRANDRSKAAT